MSVSVPLTSFFNDVKICVSSYFMYGVSHEGKYCTKFLNQYSFMCCKSYKLYKYNKFTVKLYHIILYWIHLAMSVIWTHTFNGDRHWLQKWLIIQLSYDPDDNDSIQTLTSNCIITWENYDDSRKNIFGITFTVAKKGFWCLTIKDEWLLFNAEMRNFSAISWHLSCPLFWMLILHFYSNDSAVGAIVIEKLEAPE
jgi:hypothetical protein